MADATEVSKALLEQLYHEEGLTQTAVAARLGLPVHVNQRLMRQHDIPRRTSQDYIRVEIPRETLEALYYECGLSLEAIGEQLGVSTSIVARAMRDYRLARREVCSPGFVTKQRADYIALPKEELERLYYEEGLTLKQIAAHFGVTDATVRHRMKDYGLERRRRGSLRTVEIPQEELHRLYVEEGLDGLAIAARFGCASSLIYKRLSEYGIELRPGGSDKVKRIVPEPRLAWSPTFAYAVGLIAADGNLRSGANEVKFYTTDRELAENYCRALGLRPDDVPVEAWGEAEAPQVHVYHDTRKPQYKRQYHIVFSDYVYRQRLEAIGLTPIKSLTLGVLDVPDAYFPDFLRGLFDGDGCWALARGQLLGIITSGSDVLRSWLLDQIWRLTPVTTGSNYGIDLRFTGKAALLLGAYMYYAPNLLCLSRKRRLWQAAVEGQR